jgi:hypothetical protein
MPARWHQPHICERRASVGHTWVRVGYRSDFLVFQFNVRIVSRIERRVVEKVMWF